MTDTPDPTGYCARQRERALEFAPPNEINREEFLYRASFYPLPVLRLASISRYIPARGRTYAQVLARFAEHLGNPNVNRGDDFRTALGHIEATRRWLDERGMQ